MRVVLICLIGLAVSLYVSASDADASPPIAITNVSITANVLNLSWASPSNLHIVAQSPDLTAGKFQYVGSVLSANSATLSVSNLAVSFYRIRPVGVVEFPDVSLLNAITNAVTT